MTSSRLAGLRGKTGLDGLGWCAEDEFFFFAKRQAQHQVALVHKPFGAHVLKHIELVVEVHWVRLGRTGGDIEHKYAAGIEQRREESEFAGEIWQMLQNVEGKDGIKAVFAGVLSQSVLGMEEVDRQALPRGALAGEAHRHTLNVVISCAMASSRELKKDFSVSRAVIKRGAASQTQYFHVGTDTFVFQVVSGDGKQIKLRVLPVPLRHLLGIVFVRLCRLPVGGELLIAGGPKLLNAFGRIAGELDQFGHGGIDVLCVLLSCAANEQSGSCSRYHQQQ